MGPPAAPVEEQVPDYIEPIGPAQAPKGPIAMPGLLETLALIISVYTSLALAGYQLHQLPQGRIPNTHRTHTRAASSGLSNIGDPTSAVGPCSQDRD